MRKHSLPVLIIICSLAISAFLVLNSRDNDVPNEANLPYEPYVLLAEKTPIPENIRAKIKSAVEKSFEYNEPENLYVMKLESIEEIYPVRNESNGLTYYYAKTNVNQNEEKATYYFMVDDFGGCKTTSPCDPFTSEDFDSELATGNYRVKDIGSSRDMEVKSKD